MTMRSMPNNIHEGRNVKRIREILGIKHDALAMDLGLSQQTVSRIEEKEEIDADLLEKIAGVLKVPVDAIKNFNEDAAVIIIGNTVTNNDQASMINFSPTFNPLDKVIELYERMLKEKDAMIERLLSERK